MKETDVSEQHHFHLWKHADCDELWVEQRQSDGQALLYLNLLLCIWGGQAFPHDTSETLSTGLSWIRKTENL